MRTLLLGMMMGATLASAQTSTQAPAATGSKKTAHRRTTTARKPVAKKPTGPVDATTFAQPVAHIHTSAGDMTCTLDPKQAPETVKNFIGLAQGTKPYTDPKTGQQVAGDRSKPFYNGVIFHRVIPNFMVQTGDPTGTGEGGPGFKFNDELTPQMHFDKPGKLAMANSGPNTNGSQFFVTENATPFLDPCLDDNGCQRGSRYVPKNSGYTLFGQCDDASVEVVKQIARLPKGEGDKPVNPPTINSITFTDAAAASASTAPPAAKKPAPTSKMRKPATPQQ